ncbi:hypothetical protein PGB90_000962 [Kerria lacca]
MEIWDSWLSNNNNNGWVGVHRVCETKCFKYSTNWTSLIQPLGLQPPAHPSGPPFRKLNLKFTLGKMKYGGISPPIAEIVPTMVTRDPLSADVINPTCLRPF